MDAFTKTARENLGTATNGTQSHIPTVRDGLRKVLNALETLRLAAEHEGDSLALINAGIAMDMLQGLRAGRH